jgi:bifunctional oligoribonuclease and PAP phosphatase NrnA
MITFEDAQQFIQALKNAKTLFITAHVGPDGDTLGSMLGLKHALEASFPSLIIHPVISGKMPDSFLFMPGINSVKDAETATDLLSEYDVAMSVDCGSLERLGPAQVFFKNAKTTLNIDHHFSNDRFASINIIDVNAAASGEVVADLLHENNIPLTTDAATCLYVALLTDTGGFKYSSVTAKVFELAAKLTKAGANPENIYRHIYEAAPKAQVLLHTYAIQQAKFACDDSLSWTCITPALIEEFGALEEHVDGLVEQLRRMQPVKIAATLRENTLGVTRVSLRSDVQDINVADICKRWGGGGHKMASGCTIPKALAEAEIELIQVLKDVLAQHTC